ncbi:hypothetical protein [Streptomyces sp. B3I8]|jgi:hypothetical protein|uniref:hypothetical protein n=1 Tax=Streptomyces sp. B3I8 TaxID=3042303 RepID=UPI002782F950|nr:hypothetical protein [Streptomyces sp. B3I8]MDQ0785377.1 hypothetical protein [Streptomyces sp. B3I8]
MSRSNLATGPAPRPSLREYGDVAGPHTQLTFAGALAHQLTTPAGVLGFTPHKQCGPTMRQVTRRRADRTRPPVSGSRSA